VGLPVKIPVTCRNAWRGKESGNISPLATSLTRNQVQSGSYIPMFDATLKSLWNAIKSGVIAAMIWTCVFSGVLWFFSKPTIPYFNFFQILAPYSLAFFGSAAIVFECLTQWIESDSMIFEEE